MAKISKCSGCDGKGWICDTTYDRTGSWERHEKCFGTGLGESTIAGMLRPLLKPFVKPKPKD